jgi:hypothetical protein
MIIQYFIQQQVISYLSSGKDKHLQMKQKRLYHGGLKNCFQPKILIFSRKIFLTKKQVPQCQFFGKTGNRISSKKLEFGKQL